MTAANRYAAALFEIAQITHADTEIEEELESFAVALKKSPLIEKFLNNPSFRLEEKRRFLGRIYQERVRDFYEVLLNFFTILLEKNRFNLIHEIAVEFKKIADEKRGIGAAEIRTAVPLESRLEQEIVSRLERIAGYKIRVKKEIDPALLGGVVVKIRNKVLDGSVRNRINLLKKELTSIRTV